MKLSFLCNATSCWALPLFWPSVCLYQQCFAVLKLSQVEPNKPIHYMASLMGSESNWSLTKAAASDCSEIKSFGQDLSSVPSPFRPLGQTPLPLQTSASGQSLSSTSGPVHWPCSSPSASGRPESRSKQARKRLWTESNLMPPWFPAWREVESVQGEQGVHSDHSLRRTKEKRAGGEALENTSRPTYWHRSQSVALLLPSHSLVSHWRAPSWQRLQDRATKRPR